MKRIITSVAAIFILFFIQGCKKTLPDNSLAGSWELRTINAQVGLINYPPGNGNKIKFTDSTYQMFVNNQLSKSGRYEVINDLTVSTSTCMQTIAGEYTHRIIYDDKPDDRKIFFQISNSKLTFISGCTANDSGSSEEYERQ